MGRAPCCAKVGLHRGPWTPREDTLLTNYIHAHGEGHWRSLPKNAGLLRCGKSCRLRWMNYLRPDIKRGNITADEDDLIIRLHALLGNRWSLIAGRLPGRTDNEIKNYWNTHLSKRLRIQGTDPNTHRKLSEPPPQLHHHHQHANASKKRRNTKNNNSKHNKYNNNNIIIKKQSGGGSKTTALPTEETSDKKHKVHLPKPIRVSATTHHSLFPRNERFESITTSATFSDQVLGPGFGKQVLQKENEEEEESEEEEEEEEEEEQVPSYSFKDLITGGFLDAHDDLLDPSDFVAGNSLEKLYEEYLQILKTDHHQNDDHDHDHQLDPLDSFAESLLI